MKISSLKSLLHGNMSPAELSQALSAELSEHTRALSTQGSSAPVIVVEDDDLSVTIESIQALCSLYVCDKLRPTELAYIADFLQFAERVTFLSPVVADLVAEMTDPEVNGPFTKRRALEIISYSA